jgi:hypothetical protein
MRDFKVRVLTARTRVIVMIALYFALDAGIFRSGLYAEFLTNVSMQGSGHHVMSSLEARPPHPDRDILIMGDSRIAEGFSASIANREVAQDGLNFIQAGMGGSTMRVWCYLLEQLDPQANRFRAIVLTLRSFRASPPPGDGYDARMQDMDFLGPNISTRAFVDFVSHQTGFDSKLALWSNLIVTAQQYRADFADLLLHPRARIRQHHWLQAVGVHVSDDYAGRPEAMTGLAWSADSNTLTYPAGLSEAQKQTLNEEFKRAYPDLIPQDEAYQAYWLNRIVQRYEGGKTELVLVRLPSTPLPAAAGESHAPVLTAIREATGLRSIVIMPEDTFADLEKPELFFDYRHLNAAGRAMLSHRLADLLRDHILGRVCIDCDGSMPPDWPSNMSAQPNAGSPNARTGRM